MVTDEEIYSLWTRTQNILEFSRGLIALGGAASAAHADALHQLQAEVIHWKANHNNMVSRAALLEQRPDLPVDRIPAYRELTRLQMESNAMQANYLGLVQRYAEVKQRKRELETEVSDLRRTLGAVRKVSDRLNSIKGGGENDEARPINPRTG